MMATTAKRLLGERRASRWRHWYRGHERSFRFAVRFNLLWFFTNHDKLDHLNRFEAKVSSQNGEDGILAAIFRKIGPTNKFGVEFGVGKSGSQCNTAYLLKREKWSYLWMDYAKAVREPVKREKITAENINELFNKYDVPTTFDLLSIDVDYNTYWVWKAIEGFNPRVAVLEYNSSFPPNESVAVPYDPNGHWDRTNYFGASLLAFVKLGAKKGYKLVACDSNGIDAFFVRNDLEHNFASRTIEEIYRPPGFGQVINGRHVGHPPSDRQFIGV